MKFKGRMVKYLGMGFIVICSLLLVGVLVKDSTKLFTAATQKPTEGPQMSFFTSLPVHLIGETVDVGEYIITLDEMTIQESTLALTITLENHSTHPVDLNQAVQLYLPDYTLLQSVNPLPAEENILNIGDRLQRTWSYELSEPLSDLKILSDYRLLYAPFGWSGPVILYRLSDVAPQPSVTPHSQVETGAYGSTGDPWKMLILIYRNIDTYYMEGGVQKRLVATMPDADIENMKNDFLNLPHQNIVSAYSNGTAELEAHVEVIDTPLTDLEPIADGYWPSPDVTRTELDLYAPPGKYDSVIVFWQASDPNTGQSLPVYGWGLGYWPFDYANGMTYATVFNIDWVWQNDLCYGEVFLHEWLHGVTGFYQWRGFTFPVEDLHGAEEAGYVTDANGCWKDWLKDYMRGLVYENGARTALITQTWHGGSITTYDIQNWRGEYFNNETLYGPPVVIRDDPDINFYWEDYSPHPLINPDHFSARWTRKMYFNEGRYRFYATRDDGMRIWVDDVLIFDSWYYGYVGEYVDTNIKKGNHIIRVETYEIDGWASAILDIVPLSQTFYSTGTQDGWILESSETSNKGGTLDSAATTMNLGDNEANKQYRSVLSFNTSSLPDKAVITSVKLKITQNGVVGGGNPVTTFQGFMADIKNGYFGTLATLQLTDFQAAGSKTIGPLSPTPVNNVYTITLTGAKDSINKYSTDSGLTQIRLRFKTDDNNNSVANFLKFYSGNNATSKPQLIITYYIP